MTIDADRPLTSSRKRIAFCITDLDAGGAERALVRIVTRLQDNWDCAVFNLSSAGELSAELRRHNIPVTNLAARGGKDVRVLLRLRRSLRAFRPHLLQTFLFHANMAGRLAVLGSRIPVISGIRVSEKRSRWPLRLERWTEFLVRKHVCVSQAVADFSRTTGGLSPGKLCVIPNGVDFAAFANAEPWDRQLPAGRSIPAGSPIVLFVGRLDPQKSPDTLLSAVPDIVADHAATHFVFVGDGPLRDGLAPRQDGRL